MGYGIGNAVAEGFKKVVSEKKVLYTGDQSDAEFLRKMKMDLGDGSDGFQFDVVVDDGSHVPWWGLYKLNQV